MSKAEKKDGPARKASSIFWLLDALGGILELPLLLVIATLGIGAVIVGVARTMRRRFFGPSQIDP
jgi:hypothetical protein